MEARLQEYLDNQVDRQMDPVGVDEAVGQVSPDFFHSMRMQHQRIFRLVVQVDEVEDDLQKPAFVLSLAQSSILEQMFSLLNAWCQDPEKSQSVK